MCFLVFTVLFSTFSTPGNAAGGGRVALEYFGDLSSNVTVSAYGGVLGKLGTSPRAGAGTVFLRDTSSFETQLIIDNDESEPSLITPLSSSLKYTKLVVRNGGRVVFSESDTTLQVAELVVGERGMIDLGTSLLQINSERVTVDGGTIKAGTIYVCARDVTLVNNGTVTANEVSDSFCRIFCL